MGSVAIPIPDQYLPVFEIGSFIAWLRRFEFNACIGRSNDPRDCPVANYLYSKIDGLQEYELGVIGGEFRIKDTYYVLPKWMHEFVSMVDCIDRDSMITAGRGLNILREVKGGKE